MIKTSSSDFLQVPQEERTAESFNKSIQLTSVIVDVIETFPDRLIAKVDHSVMGQRLVAYTPDSGVVKGAAAILNISSGQPRLIGLAHFGAIPDECVLFDPDSEKLKDKITPNLSPNPDSSFDDIVSRSLIVKHIEGEKVYHNNLSFIKLGHGTTTIGYGLLSKATIGVDFLDVTARRIAQISGNSTKELNTGKETKNATAKTTITRKKDDYIVPIYKEFKGDVAVALSEEGVSFDNTILDMPSLDDTVVIEMVISYNVDEFKFDNIEVEHTYKKRELSISKNVRNTLRSRPINKVLSSKANASFGDSSAITGTIDGMEVCFVYLKSVDRKGNVFIFNAGDRTELSTKKVQTISNDKKDFVLGDSHRYVQGSSYNINLPVSVDSLRIDEEYSQQVVSNFGAYSVKDFKETSRTMTSTVTTYDAGDGNIEASETINSSNVVLNYSGLVMSFKEDDGKAPTFIKKMELENGDSITHTETVSGTPLVKTEMKSSGNTASVTMSTERVSVKTSGDIIADAQKLRVKADRAVFDTMLYITKGLSSAGDFVVSALKAKRNIFIESRDAMQFVTGTLVIKGDEQLALIGPSNLKKSDGKSATTPVIVLGETSIFASEFINIVAADSTVISSRENLSLSSKNVTGCN